MHPSIMLEMLQGASIATVVGILLGRLLARSRGLDTATEFYITFLYSMPMSRAFRRS